MGYLISLATRSYRGVKVGLDCANGSAWMIAKSVFDTLGAKTYVIHHEPNGCNINADCGSTHIEQLQRLVLEQQLDVGFAFDGDADRCLCVDETGKIVDGDAMLYICGRYLKECGALSGNTVVTTVMSNMGLYRALEALDIAHEKTKVGDKYVYEAMQKNGFVLGGEQSGHIIFKKYATTGDGILTAIKVMEVMLEKKMSLHMLAEPLVVYPQVLKNVRVTDKTAVCEDLDVKKAIEAVTEALGDSGQILVRPSGTEPVVRIMVEAKEKAICKQYADKVIELIARKGYQIL